MTPKEKAEELVMSFYNSESSDGYRDVRDIRAAHECALIAVDEILAQNISTPTDYGASWTYWQLVKQEIQNL